ncbi:nitroreductase [Bacteroidia bacterium]|nr:nitroreductase [Bacteroidia bacterium]
MKTTLKEAIKHRRSYYSISNQSPVSDSEIQEILRFAVKNVPSAFNSQSTRVVLLLNEQHAKLWSIVGETLRKLVPAEAFPATEQKINSFAAGYGTILFFEDQTVVNYLQENFPLYADNFVHWSEQTNAMHQFAVWTLLEDAGFGISLQHYNPLIDEEVKQTWKLSGNWRLMAQMPFGTPTQEPGEKSFEPVEGRVLVFN